MLVGIVSDTHGHVEYAREAAHMLESFAVNTVIHCGDIGSPDIVPIFRAWPTHFVFGNVDYDQATLRSAIRSAGQHCHERFGSLELEGVSVAVLHGDDGRALDDAARSGRYQMVCYGHTHAARIDWRGDVLVLNPGALYRATPHTLAVVDLPSRKVEIVPL